ncbi:MAG: hypothetical protein ACOZIN_14475 [Myxococcota bacterium]
MTRTLTLSLMLLAPAALAESAGGLSWKAPAGWKTDGPRPMRVATYKIAAAKGDPEEAELAVFYFGKGEGGAVDANLTRWYGQFVQPDGKPSDKAAKTEKKKVNGLAVTTVDLSGTYTASMGPMAPKTNKAGYRLLGAIVEGPEGNVFFKLTGPAKTVAAAKADFDKLLGSLSK